MKRFFSWKRFIFIAAITMAATGGAWYFLHDCGPIYNYEESRDKNEIISLFEADRYWLTDNPHSNPEFMLKYRAPNTRLSSIGTMGIKVLREKGSFVGFVTYYMDPFEGQRVGRVLFLGVHPNFRGKRYGQQLLEYAAKELIKMGAQRVTLTTRPTNERALALYTRAGFVERDRDDRYVHLDYYPGSAAG